MSIVKDSQGNILNVPAPGCGRYIDENSTVIDWFATHPRPVETQVAPAEVAPAEVAPAEVAPAEVAPALVVPTTVSIGQFADRDTQQGDAIDHSVSTGDPLFAEPLQNIIADTTPE